MSAGCNGATDERKSKRRNERKGTSRCFAEAPSKPTPRASKHDVDMQTVCRLDAGTPAHPSRTPQGTRCVCCRRGATTPTAGCQGRGGASRAPWAPSRGGACPLASCMCVPCPAVLEAPRAAPASEHFCSSLRAPKPRPCRYAPLRA
eukprot:265189-Alexandrium_andersonii.AAC.1